MTQEINGNIVEIWASPFKEQGEDSLIRVNGKIVCMSPDFPVDVNFPLQYDKNESCVGGEFYITDHNVKPMVFSLKDLMLNSGLTVGNDTGECTTKYFEGFNLEEYTTGVTSSLYKVAFIKQDVVSTTSNYNVIFGSGGLPVGSYSYSYRYVTGDGDRSAWSPISEMIPVTFSVSDSFPEHPNIRTFSKDPDISVPSNYGNHIRLRYDNENNYDFIEVRRDSWYAGNPLPDTPVSEIIGAFDINNGVNVVDIFDRVDSNEAEEAITIEELTDSPEDIETAKSVRYFNSQLYLMNVKYASRDVDDKVTIIDEEQPVIPVVQKMGKKGHSHAYNSTYYKSNMRGEVQGFGLILFSQSGNKSYASDIIQSYQMPNRRDAVGTDSIGLSYLGLPSAANSDGAVSKTFEVFDHVDAKGREGTVTTNLLDDLAGFDTGPYETMKPVSQNDNSSDYSKRVNKQVQRTLAVNSSVFYNPRAFGLNYYSQGIAIKGIDDSQLQDFDGFSVVQTSPAKRVIAQGLGMYDLEEATALASNTSKRRNSIIVNFPDLDGEIGLTPEVIDDLINNVGIDSPYKLQCVSPLGFFSEVYSFFRSLTVVTGYDPRSKGVDFITYARVILDTGNENFGYNINPFYDGSEGLEDGVGGGYTAFGTWRDGSINGASFPSNTNPNLFDIIGFQEVPTKTGVGVNYRVTVSQNIYEQSFMGNTGPRRQDCNDDEIRAWQEPMYVVNIVKDGAAINPGLTTSYNYTGHYIKFKSKILDAVGSGPQSAVLVSERWEDCIPRLTNEVYNAYATLERFVWVTGADNIAKRWLNVSFKTAAQISVIENDIATNGFHTITDSSGSYNVYGVYTSSQTLEDEAPIFTLTFDGLQDGDFVEVRYDNRIPIRVFGGDTYINEHIWAVQDNEYDRKADPISGHDWRMNSPFPFGVYEPGDDYNMIRDTNAGLISYFPDFLEFKFDDGLLGTQVVPAINPASIRQHVLVWTAESRVNLSFAYNNETDKTEYAQQFFPLRNYIPRPYKWRNGNEDVLPPDNNNFLQRNNMIEDYYDDYDVEWLNWGKGGFRYKPQVNIDYSKRQTTDIITSVPALGFQEETDFCTRIVWSVKRPINIQDSPTVKTFLPNSYFDISDDTGEIKFSWDNNSSRGSNLYAITNNGVCLLLVDKRILSEVNANELATIGSDAGGILKQLWLTKEIGMDDETWRSWAEYNNALFWSNNVAKYNIGPEGQVVDITETGYNELYRRLFQPYIGQGYDSKMAGVYDVLHKEYWSTVNNGENANTLIFGVSQQALQCQSDYVYDKYLSINNDVYGMKGMQTFKLGVGNLLDGQEYECYVTGVSDKDMYFDKEFIRIRVNSRSKPKRIEFYDDYEQYKTGVPSSIVDAASSPVAIKDYFGYECYIPRKDVPPNNRQQGRLLLFKIVSEEDEEFFITTTGVQYKALK
jgi:hypothetical protein